MTGGIGMLGQLKWEQGKWGRPEREKLYGVQVLRTEADPSGPLGRWRIRRAGKALRRNGAFQVLLPPEFDEWPLLCELGLHPVETAAFVRAQSVPLVLEGLERRGIALDRATVALRGVRVDGDVRRAALELCPKVKNLVVDIPGGGEALAQWLRREFGIPILPPREGAQLGVRFHPCCTGGDEAALGLYGPKPDLAGLSLEAPELAEGDRRDLSLMAALWEAGRLGRKDIKIT